MTRFLATAGCQYHFIYYIVILMGNCFPNELFFKNLCHQCRVITENINIFLVRLLAEIPCQCVVLRDYHSRQHLDALYCCRRLVGWRVLAWLHGSVLQVGVLSVRNRDDVIKWKHFPPYWHFVMGIHRSPVDSHYKCQWRWTLMLSLIRAWTNGCANTRDAGDLRRHRADYDIAVMWIFFFIQPRNNSWDEMYATSMQDTLNTPAGQKCSQ